MHLIHIYIISSIRIPLYRASFALCLQYDSSKTFPQMVELLENQAVVISPENTECPICFSDVPKGEGIMLKECLHTFCRFEIIFGD